MADIPLFPDANNVAKFRDFVNIQKENLDLLMAEKKQYEQIGRINLDIEKRVVQRRQNEQRLMDRIQTKVLEHEGLMEKKVKARGDSQQREANRLLKANERAIIDAQTLLSMSRMASDVEMDMAKRRYDDEHKWSNFASSQLKNIIGLKVEEYDLTKSIGEELIKLGVKGEMFAYAIGGTLTMIKGAYDLFNKMDKAAWEFRKAMGFIRTDSAVIRKDAQRIAIDYMNLGVTVDSVYKSYQSLGRAVGGVHNVTKSMAEDVAIMSAQLGISEETSAGFLRNMAAISKNTMESQTNMMYVAQNMSAAAGVQLDEVMKNIASRSNTTLTMMSRLPNVALRSAIELQRMGTSLDQASKSSRHILDFTENVNEEMEASVLLGRSINLQRARELAYRRDLEGSTKEILRITKSVNFENLDVFQQEAFARATGKSVDELLKMLQTSRQLEHVKRAGTPEQKAQLALYEKMRQENEKSAKARAKDSSLLLRTMNNQTRLAAISAKWNQILAQAQEWLLPIVDNMLSLVIPTLDIARGLFAWVGALRFVLPLVMKVGGGIVGIARSIAVLPMLVSNFATRFVRIPIIWNALTNLSVRMTKIWLALEPIAVRIGKGVAFIGRGFAAVGRFLGPVGKFFASIGTLLGKIFSPIGKFLGFFGKFGGFLGMFGKYIPVIGWVIAAFQFIGNSIARMKGIGDAFNKGFFHGIWSGLKAIVGALYDTLIKPFVDAFKYIWHFFGGKSPSLLGMGIVNGIMSISTMLFKVITTPFDAAFKWVTDKFAGIGGFVGRLIRRGESVEKKATAAYIPAVTVTPNGTEIAKPRAKTAEAGKADEKISEPMSEATGCKIVALLEKILAKDNNIHMDGQLLSTHLARQTEFRGGYGVNKVA